MKRQSNEFRTLTNHRREKLRLKQSEIARRVRTSQGMVSRVENGHLPEPWEWKRWADAYEVSVEQFVAMVRQARELKALSVPVAEDMPLFAMARTQGERVTLNEAPLAKEA